MKDRDALRCALLSWYDRQARTLAWRVSPADRREGVRGDPYRVWLSEVMLQQTTVPHATPYFLSFTQRWPTVLDLAAVEDGDLMAAWAGLGYYARARNLLACARAVAAIAFDRQANVVDGNVERVMARLFAVETPVPDAKPQLKALAGDLVTAERPGDWAQALMDLGATVCRPKSPLCDLCPISAWCEGLKTGAPQTYPRKTKKADRPRRYGVAYLLARGDEVALVRRPPKGLLGDMLGLPTSDWRSDPWSDDEAVAVAPAAGDWRDRGAVEHVFTHFSLTLRVFAAEGDGDFVWTPREGLGALPSVFLKAALAGERLL